MTNIAGIKIPDSRLTLEAQDILKEHGSELLWNHSNRWSGYPLQSNECCHLCVSALLLYIYTTVSHSKAKKIFENVEKSIANFIS